MVRHAAWEGLSTGVAGTIVFGARGLASGHPERTAMAWRREGNDEEGIETEVANLRRWQIVAFLYFPLSSCLFFPFFFLLLPSPLPTPQVILPTHPS